MIRKREKKDQKIMYMKSPCVRNSNSPAEHPKHAPSSPCTMGGCVGVCVCGGVCVCVCVCVWWGTG